MKHMSTYRNDAPYSYTAEETPADVLEQTREKALKLLRAGQSMLRSCWVCNSAHTHMIAEDEAVLTCFSCGHIYLGGVDITIEGETK